LVCPCAALLASCASTNPKLPQLPSADVIAVTVQRAFAETRLAGAPRVSVIRQVTGQTPGDWMMCLKGDAPAPLYAVIFQTGQYLSSRPAEVADRCDVESYVPAPSPAPPASPPPPPLVKKRGSAT
jgi:hypothetical protein